MKKIIFFILLLIANYTYSQVKVSADGGIIPTGLYPAVDGVNVKGDIHDVQSIIERNAIPANFRRIGMLAYVVDSLKYYQLKTGIANTDWYEFKGNGDTTYTQLPLYVDTAGGIRTLKIFHPDGYEGGIVTYTGTGFDFNVSPITLFLNNKVFLFPEKTITLSAPNSLPRYDIFGVDSLGAFVKSGDTSALPIEPQIGVDSFALTKAFLISPGDTAPSNITTVIIYDQNTEWTTGTQGSTSVVDFDNTDNPFHLTKDIFISKYNNNSRLYFVNGSYVSTENTPQSVLLLPIYLNSALPANNNIYIRLYDTLTASTNLYRLGSNDNFNKNEVNAYQTVVIPTSNLTWINNKSTFTSLLVTFTGYDTSGANGLYMDYVRLQKGLSQTGSGSCPLCIVDIHVTADSMYQVSIRQNGDTASIINWTGGGGSGGINSVVAGDNISVDDTDPSNPVISAVLNATPSFQSVTDVGAITNLQVSSSNAWTLINPADSSIVGTFQVTTDGSGHYGSGLALYPQYGTSNFTSVFPTSVSSAPISLVLPNSDGRVLVSSVNGEYADDNGNVTISGGGGSYQLPYNGNATDYLGGDTAYHALPTPSLQEVTDVDSVTTHDIYISSDNTGQMGVLSPTSFYGVVIGSSTTSGTGDFGVHFNTFSGIPRIGSLLFENLTSGSNKTLQLPNTNGTLIATVNGIPPDVNGNVKTIDSTVTLSSGTITVSDTRVKTGARIFVSCNTPSGTQGFLSAKTSDIVDGTSFIINSSSASDNSTVNYTIINE